MLSGGYIAEHNGLLYYANHEDENKLYQMDTNFENKLKLSESTNFSPRLLIQFSDSKLFYLQNNISDTDEIVWTLYSYDLEQHSEVKVFDENICSYTISGGLIYFSTLDKMGVYYDKEDNMLCISTDIHQTSPQIEFGYANIDGSKLIVLYDHEIEDNSLLTYFDYAIDENGNVYEVKYSAYQERSEDDNYRQLMTNFDNEPGCIYDVIGSTVIPNNTYMFLTKEEYEKTTVFQEVVNSDEAAVSNETKEECANTADRNVKDSWVLAEYQNGYSVSMIEFEGRDRDLLAWLVLQRDDTFQCCEFPATLFIERNNNKAGADR